MAENIVPTVQFNITELLNDEKVKNFYVNGFSIGHTLTESHIILLEHGKPTAVIQMTLTVAKTLANSLYKIVDSYEQQTKQPVKSLEEIVSLQSPGKKI